MQKYLEEMAPYFSAALLNNDTEIDLPTKMLLVISMTTRMRELPNDYISYRIYEVFKNALLDFKQEDELEEVDKLLKELESRVKEFPDNNNLSFK